MIVIQYTTNGNLYRKLYYNNKNQLHNTNGPAQIWYYNNIVKKEDYFINNMAHREKWTC